MSIVALFEARPTPVRSARGPSSLHVPDYNPEKEQARLVALLHRKESA